MFIQLSRWETFRALRHRNFRLYITGMAVSLAGTAMQQLAQSWLVYRLTRSEWMLGLTWFCANIPVLLVSPLAGLAADHWPRRRIVLVTQSIAMVQAVLLAALTLTGAVRVWHVLVLAGVLGLTNAFDIPGRQALFIRLVGREDLLNAISLNSATFNSARVFGPSLAGFIVAAWGEGACFTLNSLSFLAVLASLVAMDVQEEASPHTQENALHRLRSGFLLAWNTRPLRSVLLVCGTISLAIAPAITLAPMFADALFHRGSEGLGLLTGAMGVGAILGTLSLARRRAAHGLPGVILMSAAILAAALAIFAWSPSYWVCLGAMPFIGMAVMRHNAATNTTIQLSIPDQYRGRVMSLYSMMVIGMFPVGSLVSGALADQLGSRFTVFLGAIACLGAAGVVYQQRGIWTAWLAE